jgi:enoyl-CoA hydratase/carnithine racemase
MENSAESESESESEFTTIHYHVDHRVAVITLNRPDRRNAFNPAMALELVTALTRAEADDGVRVIVVTGAGRAFCVGADMQRGSGTFDAGQRGTDEQVAFGFVGGIPRDRGGTVSLRVAALRKPVVGAVNGDAIGVGATMLLPMDIRVAAKSTRFGFVFTRRGIVPEAASTWFLPRVVGISRAAEWVATGRLIRADEALAAGLVSRVVGDGTALDTALEIAREIADNTSAVAVGAARQLLWQMLGVASPWEAHHYESAALSALGGAADAAEGVTSFLEKRTPSFPLVLSRDYPAAIPSWPTRPRHL